ncbi:MAG: N-acetyltransferase [Deltaproteobacteria bacterium]|nr:N-acetyltransferase [Deltaproteobacteria bacterium]
MEIRPLRPGDDRTAFRCGDEALDRFFRQYAGQNQFRHHLGVTWIALQGARILAFATVAPRHLDIEGLPERMRKQLPRYPLPVLGLARLSLGLGAQLLRFVNTLALKLADEVGCAGVVVDAKPGAVSFYATYGFTVSEPLEGQSDERPRPTMMGLPIRAIRAAAAPER